MDNEPKLSPEEEAREEAKDITFRIVMMSLPVIAGGGLLAAIAHVEAEKRAFLHPETYWNYFFAYLVHELLFIALVILVVWVFYRLVLLWQLEKRGELFTDLTQKEKRIEETHDKYRICGRCEHWATCKHPSLCDKRREDIERPKQKRSDKDEQTHRRV